MSSKPSFSSSSLHILAMLLMLCDHIWAVLFIHQEWLTCIGRMAFPIFAFLLVEGYFHTKDIKKYMLHLLMCAVISEVPFNLMYANSIIYPFHQNVIWLFLISLLFIICIEKMRKKLNRILFWILCVPLMIIGYVLCYVLMLDYYGAGFLMIMTFYFFRDKKWYNYIFQFACLYVINVQILGGYYYDVSLL